MKTDYERKFKDTREALIITLTQYKWVFTILCIMLICIECLRLPMFGIPAHVTTTLEMLIAFSLFISARKTDKIIKKLNIKKLEDN